MIGVALVAACGGAGGDDVDDGGGGSGNSGAGGSGLIGPSVCPNTDPWPEGTQTCQELEDCDNGGVCAAEYQDPGCGACWSPEHQCQADEDCGVGMVCQRYTEDLGPCNCTGETQGERCMPTCTPETCAADETCTASGHCEPTSCDAGFACSADRTCLAGDASADSHGCIARSCAQDWPCDAGAICAPGPTADEHGCAPEPCNAGYACPTGYTCAPSNYADPHGCTVDHCTSDGECGPNFRCDADEPGIQVAERSCTDAAMKPDGDCAYRPGAGTFSMKGRPLAEFVDYLSRPAYAGGRVVDETGITGPLDIDFEWMLDFRYLLASRANLTTALREQLGLKLEHRRLPLPVLVIEHIQRPSGN